MRFSIIFCTVWLVCFNASSRDLDSSLKVLEKQLLEWRQKTPSWHRDTMLVNLLQKRYRIEVQFINTEQCINTAKEALALSEKIHWKKGIATSLFRLAEGEQVKSNYFSAIKYSLKVLSIIDKKEMTTLYLQNLRIIAGSYMWMEKSDEALRYYQVYLKEISELYPKEIPASFKDQINLNDAYTEIAIIHTKYSPNSPVALKFYKKAKEGYEAQKDTFGLAYMGSYLGLTYEQLYQSKLAEKSFDFSINYFKKIQAGYLLADAQNNAAEYYHRKGDFVKANTLANEALKIAKTLNIFYSIRDANRTLYHNYKINGNFKEALQHFEAFANARDSMSQANIDDRLKVVRYEYDTQIQKAEIDKKNKEAAQKNILIFGMLLGLLGFLVIGVLAYRNINIRKQIAEKEVAQLLQEKQLIATNAILKGQETERTRLARDLHDGLGGLLSGIKLTLNTMSGNVILSEEYATKFSSALWQLDNAIAEMRRVAHSMMPEALLKFGLQDALQDYCEGISKSGKLQVQFQALDVQKNLEQSVEIALYRIVQELLNNTIKHAEATHAYVQLMQHGRLMIVTVEDNGKGFDTTELAQTKGVGMSNIESRVAYLKGKLDIKSDAIHGTSVEVQVML